jgi:pimeloyl-ACP methyl ester carboxylesterase
MTRTHSNSPIDTALPTLVCLHSSASSPAQWRALAEQAAGRYNVVTPNLIGYGDAPPSFPRITMADRILQVGHLVWKIPGPVHLVGHSFGGAVALQYALQHADTLASLAVYESVSFDLLFSDGAPADQASEVNQLGNMVIYLVKRGLLERAGERFIDYWSGSGTWASIPDAAKNRLVLKMPAVAWEFQSLFNELPAAEAYGSIDIPVEILRGNRSPEPVRWVAQKLAATLPQAELHDLEGLDHMGPLNRPDMVNPEILDFVGRTGAPQSVLRDVA